MAKSAMELLRSGNQINIPLASDGLSYSVTVNENAVTIYGCDCASSADEDEVRRIHEALGAWLRIQRARRESQPEA